MVEEARGGNITRAIEEDCRPEWCPLSHAPEWVSVEDRLPEELTPVNIVWVNRKPPSYYANIKDKPFTATGIFYRDRWYWYSVVCEDMLGEYGDYEPDRVDEKIEITHWMPLPEPPEVV